jgi:putative peptidoglycan lipid II flippase
LEQLITAAFLSALSVGSVAAFNLASNLQSFPINVFGVSLAIAAFPIFSHTLGLNDRSVFIQHFKDSVRLILFYVVPLSILFLVLRAQMVRVVLGAGVFSWNDTVRTAEVFGFLAMAMVSDALVPLVARVFYALGDTRTPATVAIGTVVTNVLLLLALQPFGLAGIGLAYVLSRAVSLSLLVLLLGRRLGALGGEYILHGAWRMTGAALAAGSAAYATLHLLAPYVDMHTFIGIFTQGVGAGVVGVLTYLGLTTMWRLPEVEFVERWLVSAWRVTKRLWSPA